MRTPLAAATALLVTAAVIAPAVSSAAISTDPTTCDAQANAFFIGLDGGESIVAPSQADCIISDQIQVGTGVLREGFNWSDIERSPGQYSFGYYDTWMAAAARHNMRVLPVLAAPPAFRAKTPGPNMSPPQDNADFGRFAAALVDRYGPTGSFWAQNPSVPKKPITSWQIWNEPNLPQYWAGAPSAGEYAALLKVASAAIKQADPTAEVVTAGMPESTITGAIPASKYVPQLYEAGAADDFDTLALNPYATTADGVIALVRAMRGTMARYHDELSPLWITEVGWATGGPKHRFNIGEGGQADQLERLLDGVFAAREELRLRGLIYYDWKDRPPYPPDYTDQWGLHTGLLRSDGTPKPAYSVLARLGPLPSPTGTPTIAGTRKVGETLTADHGTWNGSPGGYAYEWERCTGPDTSTCAAITGADADDGDSTYTLTGDDLGAHIRVEVTASNVSGSASADSEQTETIGPPPSVTHAPSIAGLARVGETLTADHGTWDGSPTGYGYVWQRCSGVPLTCATIGGTTDADDGDSTYTVADGDRGGSIRVLVTATNGAGSAAAYSGRTGVVGVPRSTSVPRVTGTVRVGETLTADHGAWDEAPTGYGYVWQRCNGLPTKCTPITGTTDADDGDSTYTVTEGDRGSRVRVVVTATNAAGSAAVSSKWTGVVPAG